MILYYGNTRTWCAKDALLQWYYKPNCVDYIYDT